jgi:hypothetical protein
MFQKFAKGRSESLAQIVAGSGDTGVERLRHRKTRVAADVDREEWRDIHGEIQRHAAVTA